MERDRTITVTVSQRELEQIAEAAAAERETPDIWVRSLALTVARRFIRLAHGQ